MDVVNEPVVAPPGAIQEAAIGAGPGLPTQQDPLTGDIIVDMGDPAVAPAEGGDEQTDFQANLAEFLSDSDLNMIANKLLIDVDRDVENRKEFLEVKANIIKELGFDRDNDKRDDPFPGASNVVYPLIAMTATDLHARIMKEMWAPGGPVRTQVPGHFTDEKQEKADRVKRLMDLQCTVLDKKYRKQEDLMFSKLGYDGTCFKKVYWEGGTKICSTYVPVEDVIIPYPTPTMDDAERITHRMLMSQHEVRRNQLSGLWRDCKLNKPSEERNSVQEASDKVEKKTAAVGGEDDRHTVYETHCYWDLPGYEDPRGLELPYVVTVEKGTRKVLSIYRNWWPEDEEKKRKECFVDYILHPWNGVYGLGLPHMIGGISRAAVGTLRALIDAGIINNAPMFVRLKGSRISGQELRFGPLEAPEIDAVGTNVEDIRQIIMPLPTKGPDQTLFQLLGFLVEAGKDFANVNTAMIAESTNAGPVGTTLALLEEGAKVFNAIFARVHESKTKELQIIHDLIGHHFTDEAIAKITGEKDFAFQTDFDQDIDVLPVSDPNASTTTHKIAQNQVLMQLAKEVPGILDSRKVMKRGLLQMGISDVDELMTPDQPEPEPCDAMTNLIRVAEGMPVKMFPGQDPDDHYAFYYKMLISRAIGLSPTIGPRVNAGLRDLMAQCQIMRVANLVGMAATGNTQLQIPFGTVMPPQVERMLTDRISSHDVMAVIEAAHAKLEEKLAPDADKLKTAIAMIPPPPKDPAQLSAEAELMKVQNDRHAMEAKVILQGKQMEVDQQIAEHQVAHDGIRAVIAKADKVPPTMLIQELQAAGLDILRGMGDNVPADTREFLSQFMDFLQQFEPAVPPTVPLQAGQAPDSVGVHDGTNPGDLAHDLS